MKISVQDIESLEVSVTRRLRRDRRRRIGRDRHARTGLQLELSERNDAVAGLQAFQDLGAALDAVAGLHEGAGRGQAALVVAALLLLDQEHGVAIERVVDRRFRNGDDRRLVRQYDRGAGEHAGLEDLIGVGDRGLDADVARVGRNLRLDGGDLALEGAARKSVDLDAHDLVDLERAGILLRYREVQIEHREIRQRHDLRARGEILADLDLADAEFAVERRAHQLLRDDGFGLGDAGLRLVERRLRLVDGRLRAELA